MWFSWFDAEKFVYIQNCNIPVVAVVVIGIDYYRMVGFDDIE